MKRLIFFAVTFTIVVSFIIGPASAGVVPLTHHHHARASTTTQPNIVLILTDDQRYDELKQMPNVESMLVDKGVNFTNGFVSNPLCCPSRSTILTGEYSGQTGVWNNIPPYGGFEAFTNNGDDKSTIATWLTSSGYRTALIGKYLNGYETADVGYHPPGWSRWVPLILSDGTSGDGEGGYYDYNLGVNGALRSYGSAPQDYSTDVLSQYAMTFIRHTPAVRPLFLYFSVRAPHGPTTPAPRYVKGCSGYQVPVYPNYNEADVSDKPPYIQNMPLSPNPRPGHLMAMCRSLLAVDDAVGNIVNTLQATGRLSNTLIMFASDNGLEANQHRWVGKTVPYEESLRVPIVIRDDAVVTNPGTEDHHLVMNLDFAPTFAAAAGVDAPNAQGMNMLPLLNQTASSWRSDFLIEHGVNPNALTPDVPSYCGVHTENAMYVKYSDGFEELYDLQADPFELENKVSDPAYADEKATLHARMVELCNPTPPGFTP